MTAISVAICTRNRATFLQMCLSGLLAEPLPPDVDVIVVDNGSNDETASVAGQFPCRVISEPTIGLSHARNTALRHASGAFIVYLDDDGIPDHEWLSEIRGGIRRHRPDIFGGPYRPFYLSPKPHWYDDDFGSAHLDLEEGLVGETVCFSGGNMGWRAELLKSLGGFDPSLGMVGTTLGLGEETALQVALQRRPGIRRVFFPGMSMRHYVSPQKCHLRYIARRSYQYGWQLRDIDPRQSPRPSAAVARFATSSKLGLPLLWRIVVRDRRRWPHWKTYAARFLSLHMIQAGVAARSLAEASSAKSFACTRSPSAQTIR